VGLTSLWRHADSRDEFGDDMTVYPDHAAARAGVAAIMAALIARESGADGCYIGVAQMETVFMQLAAEYLRESLAPGSFLPRDGISEFDAPSGLLECQGEDAYCVVDIDGDDDWRRLAEAIGRPDLADSVDFSTADRRVARREELNAALSEWTGPLTPDAAAQALQAAGIAAGAARHVRDLADDPHLRARGQFVELQQPGQPAPLLAEAGPALFEQIPAPVMRPAPAMGQHTREICRELLGLIDSEVDELVAAGILEESHVAGEMA
jgi:crotonobetainyl-CoA:carnitine CoA-transferase CaiB-like acyl-CoA transferase